MKKNLTFLTGIVFLLTILVAVSCGDNDQQNGTPANGIVPEGVPVEVLKLLEDSTIVGIYLTEIKIGDDMHLKMSHARKPKFEVIDGLISEVYPGYTVIFLKGQQSKIEKVTGVTVLDTIIDITPAEIVTEDVEYYRILIDSTSMYDTIAKYEIRFFIKNDTTEYIVDPYLQVPPTP